MNPPGSRASGLSPDAVEPGHCTLKTPLQMREDAATIPVPGPAVATMLAGALGKEQCHMASYADLAAVHPVVPGVCALTVRGREACVPLDVLKKDALDLLLGDAGALAYTADGAGGTGERVIGVLTDTLLVREGLLDWLSREVLIDVGGEGRFADPETALFDIQWRLNILGHHVVTAAGSPRMEEPATDQARMLRRRGLLTVLDVVLSARWRGVLLPVAQLLAVTGALSDSGTDTTALDLQRSPGGDDIGDLRVPTRGLIGAYAVDGALDGLSDARGVRDYIQRVRRVPDVALAQMIAAALPTVLGIDSAARGREFDRLARLTGLDEVMREPMHVLVVVPAEGRGGARADRLLERLGRDVRVRRVDSSADVVTEDGVVLPGLTADHTEWADVIVLIEAVLDDAPGTGFSQVPLIVDLSTLDVLGWLMNTARTDNRARALEALMERADRILVADEAQRDLVLGALAGMGRINDVVYDNDPSLNGLVAADPGGEALEASCRRPLRAADAGSSSAAEAAGQARRPNDLALVVRYMREGGVKNVMGKVGGRIRRIATAKENS